MFQSGCSTVRPANPRPPQAATPATGESTTGLSSSTSSTETGDTEAGTTGSSTADSTSTDDTTGSEDTGDSTTTGGGVEPQLVVVGAGRTLFMYGVSGGALVEVDSAEVPAEGTDPETQEIFNVVLQAGENALYVASATDFLQTPDGCVKFPANGRIDRFTFDGTGLAHDSVAYEMNEAAFEADGIRCAQGTPRCEPRGLTFSPDGTRFYVDLNDDEQVQIFSVDAGDGSLAFLDEGATIRNDGLAAGTGGPYLYNGMRVFGVAGDTVASVSGGMGGNGTVVLPGAPDRILTTLETDSLAAFDLADPEKPVEITTLEFNSVSEEEALDLDIVDDTRIVAGGRNVVHSIAFDGSAFSVLDTDVQAGLSARVNAAVTFAGEDSEYVVVAYFTGGNGTHILTGGAVLYEVNAATGALTEVQVLDLPSPARALLAVSIQGRIGVGWARLRWLRVWLDVPVRPRAGTREQGVHECSTGGSQRSGRGSAAGRVPQHSVPKIVWATGPAGLASMAQGLARGVEPSPGPVVIVGP